MLVSPHLQGKLLFDFWEILTQKFDVSCAHEQEWKLEDEKFISGRWKVFLRRLQEEYNNNLSEDQRNGPLGLQMQKEIDYARRRLDGTMLGEKSHEEEQNKPKRDRDGVCAAGVCKKRNIDGMEKSSSDSITTSLPCSFSSFQRASFAAHCLANEEVVTEMLLNPGFFKTGNDGAVRKYFDFATHS